MSAAIAVSGIAGWVLALTLLFQRLRSWRVAGRVAHEVRGALAAIGLCLYAASRDNGAGAGAGRLKLDPHIRRAECALQDLERHLCRDRGRAGSCTGRVDLKPLVTGVVASWQEIAKAKGRGISLEWSAGESVVAGHGGRIEQALANLIDNAIEHGRGKVFVRARRVRGSIRIDVQDDGAGPVSINAIKRGRARHGHGLAIVTDVAASHGGYVEAVPSANGGIVTLGLPEIGLGDGKYR